MRFSFTSATVLALFASVASCQFFDNILTPTADENVPASQPYDITWESAGVKGTISISLLQGKTNITLQTGPVIKAGIDNLDGKFTWTPTDNGFATYGLIIQHEQNKTLSQYSHPFHIVATGGYTTTIKLSTGPSYSVSTTTSSVPSSTVTVITTSTSANITSSYPTPIPTPAFPSPSSNITLATTLTSTRNAGSPTGSSPSSTSSIAAVPTNAAVANIASGGLAMVGGLLLAFAL